MDDLHTDGNAIAGLAGVVLRCPACSDVALRVAIRDGGLTVELRGAFQVDVEL